MIRVPLASNGLSAEAIEAATEVLRSGHLTMGKRVLKFETEMAKALGRKHFVMVNSGSSANLALIEACVRPTNSRPRFTPGAKVLVPAVAWPTTIWPLIQLGLEPVFVDIDSENLGISIPGVQEKLENSGGEIQGLFAISPLGRGLDESSLHSLAKQFGITLIFDNCESLGATVMSRPVGWSGLAATYSFYFSHHITTMEGGGIATDSLELADDLRGIRSHGWSRDRSDAEEWHQMTRPEDSKFLFVSTGYNIRPLEIQAAIGLTEIPRLKSYVERRKSLASRVSRAIEDSNLQLVGSSGSATYEFDHSWMMLPLRVKVGGAIERNSQMRRLESLGIETRPILTGNFLRQPAIRRLMPQMPEPGSFPRADQVNEEAFMVGCHQDFSEDQIKHLLEALGAS